MFYCLHKYLQVMCSVVRNYILPSAISLDACAAFTSMLTPVWVLRGPLVSQFPYQQEWKKCHVLTDVLLAEKCVL